MVSAPRNSQGLHRARNDARRLVLGEQRLDERIVVDGPLGLGLAAAPLGALALGRRVDRRAGLHLDSHRALQGGAERGLQTLAQGRRPQALALDSDRKSV